MSFHELSNLNHPQDIDKLIFSRDAAMLSSSFLGTRNAVARVVPRRYAGCFLPLAQKPGLLVGPQIVTQQQVSVPQVEPAFVDDRMGPGRPFPLRGLQPALDRSALWVKPRSTTLRLDRSGG